ncbi:MAG: succinyl-diaminopimelate desuccinylase [Hyphomicrobiales bacterium]
MTVLKPDPIKIAQKLIRCPSVTPAEAGALDYLEDVLKDAGFETFRVPFGGGDTYEVDNLYARFGSRAPHFCYAGHTDVVPVGDADAWTCDPFGAEIIDGKLYGRGAEDMKASVAAFTAAAIQFIRENLDFGGSISLLITGDEEARAINGTVKLIEWAHQRGEAIDACIVGEPTNSEMIGTTIKNGRRGSLNGSISVEGIQGHVAYPERTKNPITIGLPLLSALANEPFDDGSANFPPTNLEFSSVDVGNSATNVVPAKLTARFNVRFNDHWTIDSLEAEIIRRLKTAAPEGAHYNLDIVRPVSDVFLTKADDLIAPLQDAIKEVTGRTADLSTAGGTSDARFIKNYCPVVEFGLVFNTLHQVDEHTPVEDINTLTRVYQAFLKRYFDGS